MLGDTGGQHVCSWKALEIFQEVTGLVRTSVVRAANVSAHHIQFPKENTFLSQFFSYSFAFPYFQVLFIPTFSFNPNKEHKEG